MSQQSWRKYPAAVQEQVDHCVSELQQVLGPNLTGIYLHGSLAFGCFNPTQSDIDLLVFTKERMAVDTKWRVAKVLLQCSGHPCPLEVSFLSRDQIWPWRYPTPYDFHYSEEWRDRCSQELQQGAWQHWNDEEHVDRDLAAHFTMIVHRGLCLYGQPIAEAFPAVPPADFRASLLADLHWARERVSQSPVYGILNYCRTWAYCCEGRVSVVRN